MKAIANQLTIEEQRINDVTNAFIANHYVVSNGKGAKHERADGSGIGQFESLVIECGPDDVRQLIADLWNDGLEYSSFFYQQALDLKKGIIYIAAHRLVIRNGRRKPQVGKWILCHQPSATLADAQATITTTRPTTAYAWKNVEQTPATPSLDAFPDTITVYGDILTKVGIGAFPYDCTAKDKHPKAVVYKAENSWLHSADPSYAHLFPAAYAL